MLRFLDIAGGVALILFGVRFLRKGLDRLFGDRLPGILRKLAGNRWKAAVAGFCASLLAPSSTTMSVLAVQSVRTGALPARQMVAVLLGADVGITMMVVLIALRLDAVIPAMIFVGVLLFQFTHHRVARGVGQVLLALSFILLGVGMISAAAGTIQPGGDLVQLLEIAQHYPWLLVVIAALLAVALQSSTATIGMAIGLAAANLGDTDPLTLGVPIVIGANVGVALTLLFAGWADRETRRLGVANLICKFVVAAAALAFMAPMIRGLNALESIPLEGRIAITHSGFNLAMLVLFLPWTDHLYRLVNRLVPDLPDHSVPPSTPKYITNHHIGDTTVALGQSRQEIVRLSAMVRGMLDELWAGLRDRDEQVARRVQLRDDDVDLLHHRIKRFLTDLSPEADNRLTSRTVMQQLDYLNQVETIGDIIDKNLADLVLKRDRQSVWFTDEGWAELDGFYQQVAENLVLAETAFSTQDPALARRLIANKRRLNEQERALRVQHFTRLRAGVALSHESSAVHLDLITHLKAINSYMAHVAYNIIDDTPFASEHTGYPDSDAT